MEKNLDKIVEKAKIFDIRNEEFRRLEYPTNFNCDCYTCQCDGGCDCVCQGNCCDAGPCYGTYSV